MNRQDPEELFQVAKEYFKEGHYKIAEPMLEQLLVLDPKNPELYYMVGAIFFEKGQLKKAMVAFRQSLKLDPKFTDSSIGLSIIMNDLGRYSQGKKVFEEAYALMKQKDNAAPSLNEKIARKHEELGDIYFSNRKYEESLENFNKAALLSPNPFPYQIKAIDSLVHMKLFSRALKEALVMEKTWSRDSKLLLKIGQIYYKLNELIQAREYWQKVLNGDPKNETAQTYLRHSQRDSLLQI